MKFTKILPSKLNIGDTIGVVAPSNPIIGDNIEELNIQKIYFRTQMVIVVQQKKKQKI